MLKKLTYMVSVCLLLAAATGVQAVDLTIGSDADTEVKSVQPVATAGDGDVTCAVVRYFLQDVI